MDRGELENMVLDFSEKLEAAVDSARELARACKQAGLTRLDGEIHAYTIGNLEAFGSGNRYQCGSVDSIVQGLNDLDDPQDLEDQK